VHWMCKTFVIDNFVVIKLSGVGEFEVGRRDIKVLACSYYCFSWCWNDL
jgi:hypothetical protein